MDIKSCNNRCKGYNGGSDYIITDNLTVKKG